MSNGFYLSEHKNLIINQERGDIYLKNQILHRWYAKCGVRKRGQGMEKIVGSALPFFAVTSNNLHRSYADMGR
jgi:hypothetical protein